jgi:signal transduction histidine kinase
VEIEGTMMAVDNSALDDPDLEDADLDTAVLDTTVPDTTVLDESDLEDPELEDTAPSGLKNTGHQLGDDAPATITLGWAERDDEFISVGDTIPEMLIWKVEQEASSLRDTIRDARAFERTQIIDMDEVMGLEAEPNPAEEHALSDLAGAVGHELNNPLTTCVGYLRQISDLVSSEDDQMAHMVERLGRNLNRIHSIVGELEMLAAESSDRRTQVDLATVVERVHAQLSGFLDADVELDLRQAHLFADRPRLYQLVYIMLAAHMLDDQGSDDENDGSFSVHVSSRTVGACLEIIAPQKPQGSLRLDLLGIIRRDTLAGSTPLGLAAQLTHTMGGTWLESEHPQGHRVTAVLPRRNTNTRPPDSKGGERTGEPYSKTSSGSHCSSDASRSPSSSKSRR